MRLSAIAITFHAIDSIQYVSAMDPIIDLGYVKYKGIFNATSRTNQWYGIRYAQPPIGELRWQTPRDIEVHNNYSSSILDATVAGPSCVQGSPPWPGATFDPLTSESSEDCLLLNVLAPIEPASATLPVLVQIHGGGYNTGSSQNFPGNALVYQSQGGLIYVSIQYRLGAYGFLGGAEVTENGVANVGLLDQRAALNWVQRHIGAFGGDPAKVTIIGASAGGGSVINQMIIYGGESNPPFRAVIADYPWMQPFHNDSIIQRQYGHLLSGANCSDIACLRSLSSEDLATASILSYSTAYANGEYGFGDYYYGPYVDGNVIRDLPSQEFKTGQFAKVPLLITREGYEGAIFSNTSETTTSEVQQGLETLFPNARWSFFDRLYQLYPRTAYNSTYFQRQQLFGDFIIACPTYYLGAAVSDSGNSVYKMNFDAGSQVHGALVPFLESLNLAGTSNNATLASMIRSYYISFATSLDPNAVTYTNASLPRWPRYQDDESDNFTVLNVTYGGIEAAPDNDVSPQSGGTYAGLNSVQVMCNDQGIAYGCLLEDGFILPLVVWKGWSRLQAQQTEKING